MTEINLLPRKNRLGPRTWGYLSVGIALIAVVGVLLLIASGSKKAPPVVEEIVPSEEVAVEEKEKPIAEIGERRRICMEILDRIQEAVPLFVWLTSITTTSAHEVFIQGIAFSRTRIQEFAQRLGAEEKPLIRKDRFEGRTVSKFSLAGRLPQRPTQAQPPAFISPDARKQTIEAILRKGKPLNLKIVRGPEQISLEPRALRQRFQLRGESPYDQLKAFMDYLSALPDAASISQIVITAEDAMRAGTSTVVATFTLDLYIAQE